jgi:F0F1-type ATP synthase delta subunit
MTQIIKVKPLVFNERSVMQVDEDEIGGLIIKSTSVESDSQIQFQLTKLEVKRLSDYFVEKAKIGEQ